MVDIIIIQEIAITGEPIVEIITTEIIKIEIMTPIKTWVDNVKILAIRVHNLSQEAIKITKRTGKHHEVISL